MPKRAKTRILVNDSVPIISQIYRFGAKPGDMVWVNNNPGGAGPFAYSAELRMAMTDKTDPADDDYILLSYEGTDFELTDTAGIDTNHRVLVNEAQYALVFQATGGALIVGVTYNSAA